MERLTKRNSDGIVGTELKYYNYNNFQKMARKLAEYEDLEEQGRLISLPCKVEDTVYEITGATARGYDWKYLTYENAYIHKTIFNLDRLNDIGKTVFLTKSEAEAKLKELRGGENDG